MAPYLNRTSSSQALHALKLLLSKRATHLSMRLVISIIESNVDNNEPFILDLETNRTFRGKVDVDGLLSFLATPSCKYFAIHNVSTQNIKGYTAHSLLIFGRSYPFFLPIKIGRKKIFTKASESALEVNALFDIWYEAIGSDANVYPRKPTLTKSRSGREPVIRRAIESEFVLDIEEAALACLGCRTSLFHMGFGDDGQKLPKKYCEPKHIFLNRQRVEEMMSRTGDDYTVQLAKISEKKEKANNVLMQVTSTSEPNPILEEKTKTENWW